MNSKNDFILSIKNVNKRYKLNKTQFYQALFDINIDFKAGELVSIVGESGSGKSTLMNLIGGLDSDYSGKIIVDNENLRELSDKQLDKYRKDKVGFVFQSFNLISHLSILDNVTLALTLSNISEKEKLERATKLLKSVGLERQLKKMPNQLSGGQKQRVAIARALINNPDIIIADEPTGALDTATTMQILEILKEIADSGKLVIMVTHSEKVASVSSRVIEISDGRIISDKINPNYVREEITSSSKKEDLKENIENEDSSILVSNVEVSENENSLSEDEISENENVIDHNLLTKEIKKNKDKTVKQNLSIFSALRLSIFNMWANKTKNFLMAFGVAIGIGSLILMLCFSSGISDYINDIKLSFSDPTIVTISKKSATSDMKSYETFTEEEISSLIYELNDYLKQEGYNFIIKDNNRNNEQEASGNVTYGFEAFATDVLGGGLSASIGYDFNLDGVYQDDEVMKIYYLYSTPPFYNEKNLLKGEMSTSSNGIMINSSISRLFNDTDSALGKRVKITISYDNSSLSTQENTYLAQNDALLTTQETFFFEDITAIVDTSILANYPIMYIDFNLLQYHFERLFGEILMPNSLYIQTPNEEIRSAINSYLQKNYRNEFTGSIENSLADMLSEMGDIIGTSLIVISIVALLVSAIMILVVMYMSVTERTKEIGVLKSIGARKGDIRRIFSCESLLVGILSGFMGLILAGLLILIAYLCLVSIVGLAPLSFKWYYIAIALGVSIVISTISGIYPAVRAANLDPVEALRRE